VVYSIAQNGFRLEVKMNARILAFRATRWLLAGIFLLAAAAHAQPTVVTNLITFDDLPDLTGIPNGYAQLNWSGLETITAIQDGYAVGVVSRPNAAFNPYGYDATVSSLTPFNFVSAYLTGAASQMQLEALGFAGNNLVYDQTYTLNDANSAFVTFNYAGVTQVSLLGTAGGPFVMDNLTVSSSAFTNIAAPPPAVPTNAVPGVTNVLGFDDLPDMTLVPAGYAQLNWTEFETISEWDIWFGSEYENGLISPSNVVFNPYGNNAAISRDTPFNLISAYLTGGINVEVEGYISNSLAYDQTFALNEAGPTLVTFDYWGVTAVAFVPEPMTPFAMDNLTVSGPDLRSFRPRPEADRRQMEIPW
jgi:hypothetical protein